MPATTDRKPLMSVAELAAYLNVSVGTIRHWRAEGLGPRAIKVGKHLRFEVPDVLVWLDSQRES